LLENLESAPYIGVDSEWRMTLSPLDKASPALLQLSSENEVFLVDLVSLKNSQELDD
jgi:hypothetical protein